MLEVKDPVVLNVPKIDQPDAKYRALAKKLGVTVAVIPSDLLLINALSELSIAAYDLVAVRKYLTANRPLNHLFVWVDATGQAAPEPLQARYPRFRSGNNVHGGIISGSANRYNKPIPYPVLLTMESIVAKAKSAGFEPRFYVSDYTMRQERPKRTQRLDPFLAVGTSDSDALFVIERWDEPAFREETYSIKRKASGKKPGAVKKGGGV